jgi:hypothetical protein
MVHGDGEVGKGRVNDSLQEIVDALPSAAFGKGPSAKFSLVKGKEKLP